MTTASRPLPPPGAPIVEPGSGVATSSFALWLDFVKRFVNDPTSIFVGISPTLIQVATPSNANAAAAGVAIGQLYTSTADPHTVYIRTA